MVTFFDTEQQLTVTQIRAVELSIGLQFPESYVDHLLKYNGGRCEPNSFNFIEKEHVSSSCVDYFLAIYDGDYDNFMDYFQDLKVTEKRMPKYVFPIAHDPGGNLVCINSIDGKVYFWDHEREVDYKTEEDDNFSNLYYISESFDKFLESLY